MVRKLKPLGLLFVLVNLALTGAGQGPSSKSKHGKPKIDPAWRLQRSPSLLVGATTHCRSMSITRNGSKESKNASP